MQIAVLNATMPLHFKKVPVPQIKKQIITENSGMGWKKYIHKKRICIGKSRAQWYKYDIFKKYIREEREDDI